MTQECKVAKAEDEGTGRTVPNCSEPLPAQKCSELCRSGTLRAHFGTLRSSEDTSEHFVTPKKSKTSFLVLFVRRVWRVCGISDHTIHKSSCPGGGAKYLGAHG